MPQENPSTASFAVASEAERRRCPRSATNQEITIIGPALTITGLVRDCSACGICFYVASPEPAEGLALGTSLRLLLRTSFIAGNDHPVNVVGEVVRIGEKDSLGRVVVAVAF